MNNKIKMDKITGFCLIDTFPYVGRLIVSQNTGIFSDQRKSIFSSASPGHF